RFERDAAPTNQAKKDGRRADLSGHTNEFTRLLIRGTFQVEIVRICGAGLHPYRGGTEAIKLDELTGGKIDVGDVTRKGIAFGNIYVVTRACQLIGSWHCSAHLTGSGDRCGIDSAAQGAIAHEEKRDIG